MLDLNASKKREGPEHFQCLFQRIEQTRGERKQWRESFYLQFIFGWVLSKFFHHTAELGDADVAAAVDVVLEESLFTFDDDDSDDNDDSDDYFYISDNDDINYGIRVFSSYLFVVFDLVFRQINVQLS